MVFNANTLMNTVMLIVFFVESLYGYAQKAMQWASDLLCQLTNSESIELTVKLVPQSINVEVDKSL